MTVRVELLILGVLTLVKRLEQREFVLFFDPTAEVFNYNLDIYFVFDLHRFYDHVDLVTISGKLNRVRK